MKRAEAAGDAPESRRARAQQPDGHRPSTPASPAPLTSAIANSDPAPTIAASTMAAVGESMPTGNAASGTVATSAASGGHHRENLGVGRRSLMTTHITATRPAAARAVGFGSATGAMSACGHRQPTGRARRPARHHHECELGRERDRKQDGEREPSADTDRGETGDGTDDGERQHDAALRQLVACRVGRTIAEQHHERDADRGFDEDVGNRRERSRAERRLPSGSECVRQRNERGQPRRRGERGAAGVERHAGEGTCAPVTGVERSRQQREDERPEPLRVATERDHRREDHRRVRGHPDLVREEQVAVHAQRQRDREEQEQPGIGQCGSADREPGGDRERDGQDCDRIPTRPARADDGRDRVELEPDPVVANGGTHRVRASSFDGNAVRTQLTAGDARREHNCDHRDPDDDRAPHRSRAPSGAAAPTSTTAAARVATNPPPGPEADRHWRTPAAVIAMATSPSPADVHDQATAAACSLADTPRTAAAQCEPGHDDEKRCGAAAAASVLPPAPPADSPTPVLPTPPSRSAPSPRVPPARGRRRDPRPATPRRRRPEKPARSGTVHARANVCLPPLRGNEEGRDLEGDAGRERTEGQPVGGAQELECELSTPSPAPAATASAASTRPRVARRSHHHDVAVVTNATASTATRIRSPSRTTHAGITTSATSGGTSAPRRGATSMPSTTASAHRIASVAVSGTGVTSATVARIAMTLKESGEITDGRGAHPCARDHQLRDERGRQEREHRGPPSDLVGEDPGGCAHERDRHGERVDLDHL